MSTRVGTEFRELLRLAVPIAASQAGTQLMGVVDTAVVGRLGAVALGAVGLGNALYFPVAVIAMGFVMGIDPLASQAVGAGDLARARRWVGQGMWLATIVGTVMTIPMLLTPLLLPLVGVDEAIRGEATAYLLIRAFSLVPILLFFVQRSYLQAIGSTRPLVISMLIANVFNLFADILLVFGGTVLPSWAGPLRNIPAMGVSGAAVATVLGSFLQLAILYPWIATPGSRALPRPDRGEMQEAFRIGLPVGLHWGAEVGIFALVALLAGKFGDRALAAHQLTITVASFTFTVAVGVGSAGSVRVGRAIGAGDHPGTRRAGIVAFAAGAGLMAVPALFFLTIPRTVARIITDDAAVIAAAVPLLAIAALFQISDGAQAVGAGVLRGAADTRYAFLANVVGHWVVGFPVAMLFGFTLGYGIVGLWFGLCAGLTAVAVLLYIRFLKLTRRPVEAIE